MVMIALFLSGLVSVIPNYAITSTQLYSTPEVAASDFFGIPALEAQVKSPESIRVAVYNEPNVTVPEYSVYANGLTNNYSEVVSLLTGAGYSVTPITEQDILNHKLTLANYDVFVMVNNLPREIIVNLVKEFWLGGGGVLSFNSAFVYLFYYGLLGPEMEELEGHGTYWQYYSVDIMKVSARNPITKEYQISDNVTERKASWLTFWGLLWSPAWFDSVNYGSQTILLNNLTAVNYCYGVAIDSPYRGGRVVQLIGDGYNIPTDFHSIIINSVDYLAPRPKARIAYDFSHQPRLPIDTWDTLSTLVINPNIFEYLRNTYVNHSYTVDKFYPSAAGNFTAERLAKYDMMIIDWPDLNYTVAERTALMSWVANGGSLLVLGDRSGLGGAPGYEYINFLLEDLDMSLGSNDIITYVNATLAVPNHATTEGCSKLLVSYHNYLNVAGAAKTIWQYSVFALVAGQQYGSGRVILSADANIFDNGQIAHQSNNQFAINAANWLTAATARVLVLIDQASTAGHENAYKSQVATALHNLGADYMMTQTPAYFSADLDLQDWDLLVFDSINYAYTASFPDILSYLTSHPDTRLIMDTWMYTALAGSELWQYIGFKPSNTYSPVPVTYFWQPTSPLFNTPIDMGSGPFNDTLHLGWGITATNLTVFANATAIGGFALTPSSTNVSILLGLQGRALVNGPLIEAYASDYDDSTYVDSYEIWMNEVAFMLRPFIDHPADLSYEAGSTGHSVTWHPSSYTIGTYRVDINGTPHGSGIWDGSAITINVDGLNPGVHLVTLTVADTFGLEQPDSVLVTVVDTTLPALDHPGDFSATGTVTATWTASDLYPAHWWLYVNGTQKDSQAWAGGSITVNVPGLTPGVYNFTIRVVDQSGNEATDTVMVTVNFGLFGLDTTTLILIGLGALALIIIGVIAFRRRGSSNKPVPKKKK
jgi:hypothetical protein